MPPHNTNLISGAVLFSDIGRTTGITAPTNLNDFISCTGFDFITVYAGRTNGQPLFTNATVRIWFSPDGVNGPYEASSEKLENITDQDYVEIGARGAASFQVTVENLTGSIDLFAVGS